ncbi:MAG: putative zinc-binding protein [Treponema sp.]|nr:putative zinc-binding protein [Treponema sp.]
MSKVKVVPCSGMGKVFGLVAREAALTVTGRLCPDIAETVCLAHLVTGTDAAINKVKGLPCITIDGCAALCAAKSVEAAGGIVKQQYRSVDEMRFHKGKDAGTATALSSDGWQITDELAAKIAEKAKELHGEDVKNG